MSQEIEILEKKIYTNKPFENAKGQYNYGRVNSFDSFKIMGKSLSALDNADVDLYTSVFPKIDINRANHPNGLLHGYDSEIEFYSVITRDAGPDTNDDKYYSAQWAFYMYDAGLEGRDNIFNSLESQYGSGQKIRSAIGTGNGFGQTPDGNFRIGYRYYGYQNEHSSLVNQLYSGPNTDNCEKFDVHDVNYCGHGLALYSAIVDHSDGRGSNISKRFHLGHDDNSTGTPFHTGNFYDSLLSKDVNTREDNIIMLTRTAADEKEWALFGHGWGNLGYGYENDELDRIYFKSKIPKSELYEIWKFQTGQVKLFNFHYDGGSHRISPVYSSQNSLNNFDKSHAYRDEYGENKGHSDSISENDRTPVNIPRSVQIRVKAPTFNPVYAITGSTEGGIGANWVLKGDTVNEDDGGRINEGWWCLDTQDETLFPNGERKGLHPRYNMDFFGWPTEYYYTHNSSGKTTSVGNYFHSEYIKPVRPISFVSASFNTPDASGDYHGVDLQSYYENDTSRENILRAQSSAPNNVRLKFK